MTDRVEAAAPAKLATDGYERALALVEDNDLPAALRAIQEALANHDERCNVHNLAGYILKSLNVPHLVSASVLMFERSLELWPHHTIALENLSHALVLLGRSDLAIARLSQSHQRGGSKNLANQTPSRLLVQRYSGPTAGLALAGPTSADLLSGAAATSLPTIDAAAREHATMQVDVGEAHLSLDHLELAAEAFAAAVRADRTNFSAHQKLATTLLELRWFHSALAAAHNGLVALVACAGDEVHRVGAGIERIIAEATGCVATCVAGCVGYCIARVNPENARTQLIATHGIATVALHAAGKLMPSSFASAEFEIACENERPLAWLYRHDDPDILVARHAVLRSEHAEALKLIHLAATVPHRHDVIVAFARWAGRRAQGDAAATHRQAWQTLEQNYTVAEVSRREASDATPLQPQPAPPNEPLE